MPSFYDLLEQTLPFHAARAGGVKPVRMTTDFAVVEPSPTDPFDPDNRLPGDSRDPDEIIENNLIWQFEHRHAAPAAFENLRVWSRGMGMNYSHAVPVLPRVEWGNVLVTLPPTGPKEPDVDAPRGAKRTLPLSPEFVVGAWYTPPSSMPGGGGGLWQLRTNTDFSFVVAFVFEETYDGTIVPLDMPEIEALGVDFMPEAGSRPICPELTIMQDTTFTVCLEKSRWVVLVSLTTCRERPDFAPGALVGFARFYPHLMVMSNGDAQRVESSLYLERPAHAMTHGDPEMGSEIKALLVTDSNQNRSSMRFVPMFDELPIPVASNIYDYYEVDAFDRIRNRRPRRLGEEQRARLAPTELSDLDASAVEDHPEQGIGEVTLADARRTRHRVLDGCVRREGGEAESISKCPRQGQFDSVHLAPRMRTEFLHRIPDPPVDVVLEDIAMVFVCVHDCVHMHVRWAAWASDTITAGFDGDAPFEVPGAPAVPENQTVFASLPSPHSMVYRALADGCNAGTWTVFCHHGAGYAIETWPKFWNRQKLDAMRMAVEIGHLGPARVYPNLPQPSWPGFYWRCRWTGTALGEPVERLAFDLEECIR